MSASQGEIPTFLMPSYDIDTMWKSPRVVPLVGRRVVVVVVVVVSPVCLSRGKRVMTEIPFPSIQPQNPTPSIFPLSNLRES